MIATSRDEYGVQHSGTAGAAVTTGERLSVDGAQKIVARVSATVVHTLPQPHRQVLTHPKWGVQFLAEELIEVLALITQNAIGQELAEPTWRYDVTVSGHRLNRRGGVASNHPEVEVFAPEELPEEYRARLRGPEVLHHSIGDQARTPLPHVD